MDDRQSFGQFPIPFSNSLHLTLKSMFFLWPTMVGGGRTLVQQPTQPLLSWATTRLSNSCCFLEYMQSRLLEEKIFFYHTDLPPIKWGESLWRNCNCAELLHHNKWVWTPVTLSYSLSKDIHPTGLPPSSFPGGGAWYLCWVDRWN